MAVTNSAINKIDRLLGQLSGDLPEIKFKESNQNLYSPQEKTIYYTVDTTYEVFYSSILHEIGHLLCSHNNYSYDVELLIMEKEAWEKAEEISTKYGLSIANDHIQDCLDTYRDWVHKRSTCPVCGTAGIQNEPSAYQCLNCQNTWKVSQSRFCRAYRMKKPPLK